MIQDIAIEQLDICNRCSGKRKCRFSLKSRVKTENQKNINRKMLRMVQQAYRGI